jgi:Flp pilus assembly protein TadB
MLLVLTIITLAECKRSQSTQIVSQVINFYKYLWLKFKLILVIFCLLPKVIIMIGAVLLVFSVIFMYVKWNTNRDRTESEVPQLPSEQIVPDARKSIFI